MLYSPCTWVLLVKSTVRQEKMKINKARNTQTYLFSAVENSKKHSMTGLYYMLCKIWDTQRIDSGIFHMHRYVISHYMSVDQKFNTRSRGLCVRLFGKSMLTEHKCIGIWCILHYTCRSKVQLHQNWITVIGWLFRTIRSEE